MTKSKNRKYQWGRIICDCLVVLSIGASAALLLRELREHAKALEDLAEDQHLLREQAKTLLASTERLSAAVDALSAHTLAANTLNAAASPAKSRAARVGTASSSDANGSAAKRGAAKNAPSTKPGRAKKKQDANLASDTSAGTQENPAAGDVT